MVHLLPKRLRPTGMGRGRTEKSRLCRSSLRCSTLHWLFLPGGRLQQEPEAKRESGVEEGLGRPLSSRTSGLCPHQCPVF